MALPLSSTARGIQNNAASETSRIIFSIRTGTPFDAGVFEISSWRDSGASTFISG